MFQRLNFQYLFSYLGLLPFIIIILDKYFIFQIKEEIIFNFLIHYNLIIFVFTGSINWNLEVNIKNNIVFYGFIPSLLATIIIVLNLYEFDSISLILTIIYLFLIQIILEYFLIYKNKLDKKPFYFLRFPLTLIIILFSLIIII